MFPGLLKIERISKVFDSGLIFKTSKRILENISFEVNKGKTFGIMGDSGTGKTILGKIVAGIENPSGGEIRFHGKNISKLNKEEFSHFRRKVQMVFQNPEGSLNPKKNIKKSFEEALHLIKIPKKKRKEVILDILRTIGLSEEFLCRHPHQLSGGQNQRVALGRVLLLEPEIIILDEPTSALDVSVQAQILNLLKELQAKKGFGYILISHDREIIKFMSHRIGIIENGNFSYLLQ